MSVSIERCLTMELVKPMSEEELQQIAEREKAATPGPYSARALHPDWPAPASACPYGVVSEAEGIEVARTWTQSDTKFIAHARTDIPRLLATVRDREAQRDAASGYLWRKMLWLRHGCDALYGDDGEMQCVRCMIDFKRDSAESINEHFQAIAMRRYAEALGTAHAPDQSLKPALEATAGQQLLDAAILGKAAAEHRVSEVCKQRDAAIQREDSNARELGKAREEIERSHRRLDLQEIAFQGLTQQRIELQKEIERLRGDAARLDWLERNATSLTTDDEIWAKGDAPDWAIRDAIDAEVAEAVQKEKK